MAKAKAGSGLFREDGTPISQTYTDEELSDMFEDLATYDPGYNVHSILVDDDRSQSDANTRKADTN